MGLLTRHFTTQLQKTLKNEGYNVSLINAGSLGDTSVMEGSLVLIVAGHGPDAVILELELTTDLGY